MTLLKRFTKMRSAATRSAEAALRHASDQRLHFGLGAVSTIDFIEVHWPGGAVEQSSYRERMASTKL